MCDWTVNVCQRYRENYLLNIINLSKVFSKNDAKILFRFRAGYPIKLDTDSYFCNICNMNLKTSFLDIKYLFLNNKKKKGEISCWLSAGHLKTWMIGNLTIINFVKAKYIVI